MSSGTRYCPACGGHSRLLGCLGHTRHYRCMDCGTDFSDTPRRTAAKASRAFAQAERRDDRRVVDTLVAAS